MHMGPRALFEHVTLTLWGRKRYGVVGANGAGKSTLLRMMSGELECSGGEIAISKEARVGFLKQDQHLHDDERVIDVVLQGRPDLVEALCAKDKLLAQEEWTEEAGFRIAELEEAIASLGGYEAEAEAERFLAGLGIKEESFRGPLSALSGGYKLRVLLARALFDNPDVLLLDEPTNYLDIVTISWLERYLCNEFAGLLLLVSHDRDFLDAVATHILDIDYNDIRLYNDDFETFQLQKFGIAKQKQAERAQQTKQVAKMQRFIDRFRAKASKAAQAASRQKMLDKIELTQVDKSSRIAPHFSFKQERPSGGTALKAKGLYKAYGGNQVLDKVDLEIERGERVAIIGPNGVGKSTLIKVLMDLVELDAGHFEWGHAAKLGYFAQDHREMLKGDTTLMHWLGNEITRAPEQLLRQTLGALLFSKDDVHKSISHLSGGEAARLLFARIMLLKPNVLVLDEPTNHLDLEAIEALEEALQTYEGTLLVVSHDRHFLGNIATRVIDYTEEVS